MNRKIFLITAVVALTLGCSTATPNLETYRGQALVMGAVGTGANQTIQISISRWTTDAERDTLLATLKSDGSDEFRSALFKSEETGFIKIGGRATYRMRYARSNETATGRQIVLATDRPISFTEARSPGARTRDYDVSIIVLQVDENGSGSGAFSVGTKIAFDEEKNQLVLENYSTEPVRLNSISRIK